MYGKEAGAAFLPLWRKHLEFFDAYVVAKRTKDDPGATKAAADLDGFRTDFGTFLSRANPELSATAVANVLEPYVTGVLAMVRAAATGSPKVHGRIADAASHMPDVAAVLATGITAQFPDNFTGSADAPAADLRALLTDQLVSSEYLTVIAITTGLADGATSPTAKAAAATVDAAAVALQETLGSVYGEDAAASFLPLWRARTRAYLDHARARAAADKAAAGRARAALDRSRKDLGALVAGLNPQLRPTLVTTALRPLDEKTLAALDAATAKGGNFTARLRAAAGHAPDVAATLSAGIAAQFPGKFPGA